jgi:hypothetical protein
MPGTQPGQVTTMEAPSRCLNCHGNTTSREYIEVLRDEINGTERTQGTSACLTQAVGICL